MSKSIDDLMCAMRTVNGNQASLQKLSDLLGAGKNIRQDQINTALVVNQLAMAKALQETLSVACEMSNKLDGMNKGYTGSDMVNDIFGGAKR